MSWDGSPNNRMKKYINSWSIIIVLIILVLVLGIMVNNINQNAKNTNTTSLKNGPSPTLSEANRVLGLPLSVVSVIPNDSAQIPLDSKFKLTFDRDFEDSEVEISIGPTTNFSISKEGAVMTLTPQRLNPGITYSLVVKYTKLTKLPKIFYFDTIGPTPSFAPDTAPVDSEKIQEDFQKNNHPDIYLSNQLPFETTTTKIIAVFVKTPQGHYRIIVRSKSGDKEKSRTEGINWMKSKGLTNAQINNLDVQYE